MKDTVDIIMKDMGLKGTSKKQKLHIVYFIVSFCLIGCMAEAPLWLLFVLVVNFINAVRLFKKIPIPK